MTPVPPRLAAWLVGASLPTEEREELLGDLHERFLHVHTAHGPWSARLWYWRQATGAVPRLLASRFQPVPRRGRMFATPGWRPASLTGPLRILAREPAFSFFVVLILGLGTGLPTTMYSIVRGLTRELPFPDAHELVSIDRLDAAQGGHRLGVPYSLYRDIEEGQQTLERVAAYRSASFQLDHWEGTPQRRIGATVSPGFFQLLGVKPQFGRTFTDQDASGLPAVLIAERLWHETYADAPDILGKTIRVDGVLRTVVGVLPESFGFPDGASVWVPFDPFTEATVPVNLVGRLREGATLDGARRGVAPFLAASAESRGEGSEPKSLPDVRSLRVSLVGRGMVARVLLYLVTFVLIIASANVANLLLGRSVMRARGVAVRMALGGSRFRVVSGLLGETLVLATLGALLGVVLAEAGIAWFQGSGAIAWQWWIDFHLDAKILLFAAACAATACLLAGMAPALQASGIHLADALRSESRGATSFRHVRFSRVSVGLQLLLSCTLLILTSLLVQGARRELVSSEADPAGILMGQVQLGRFDYPDDASLKAFSAELLQRLADLPGVSEASVMSAPPGLPLPKVSVLAGSGPSQAPQHSAQALFVSASYFSLMGLQAREGRVLAAGDRRQGEAVAVVDEALAAQLAPEGGTAVGRTLRLGGPRGTGTRVVGVVPGMGWGRKLQPTVYLPLASASNRSLTFAVRWQGGNTDPGAVRSAVAAQDPDLPILGLGPLSEFLRRQDFLKRRTALLFGAFGFVALILSALGLHAVVAFSVARRAKEFSIRRTLGATGLRIVGDALRSACGPVAVGLSLGTLLAFFLSPKLAPMFSGGSPHDPWVFLPVPALLALVAALAIYLPGRKAAAADPVQALHSE